MRRRLRLATITCASWLLASTAFAQAIRDPMRPAGAAPAARPRAVSTLKLEGVISGAVRVAIVNGRLVRAGDEVGGAKILEVLNDGVRYSRAGQVHSLLLPGVTAIAVTRVARSPEASPPEASKP
jgi:MSHA biogenesis protein MshK